MNVRAQIGLVLLVVLTHVSGAYAQPRAIYDTTTVDGQPTVVVHRGDDGIAHPAQGEDVTWTRDYTWHLDGLVFVNEGQTLTIEPGTVVKGRDGDGDNVGALIVARGGALVADGTPERPIIFTSERDDVTRTDDLPRNFRGGWGGVILLGRAPLNTDPHVLNVEGISLNEVRNQYGGTDPEDGSGVLRYVSIRHGGHVLEEGNEINGLTLAAVGRGTTIEFVEVFNNQDDGFEFFGGTVDAKHLVSAFTTDDSFDIDQGYRGRGQFWLAVQNSIYADHAGEHDGGEETYGGEDRKPYATPQLYNVTYVGSGLYGTGSTALLLRDNFAGSYFNSVFVDFPYDLVRVEDRPTDDTGDSRARFEEGLLRMEGNIFSQIGDAFAPESGLSMRGIVENEGAFGDRVAESLSSNNTLTEQLPIRTLSRDGKHFLRALDPRAAAVARSTSGVPIPDDPFFEAVDYVGAVGPDSNWAHSWTYLGEGGEQHPGLGLLE